MAKFWTLRTTIEVEEEEIEDRWWWWYWWKWCTRLSCTLVPALLWQVEGARQATTIRCTAGAIPSSPTHKFIHRCIPCPKTTQVQIEVESVQSHRNPAWHLHLQGVRYQVRPCCKIAIDCTLLAECSWDHCLTPGEHKQVQMGKKPPCIKSQTVVYLLTVISQFLSGCG